MTDAAFLDREVPPSPGDLEGALGAAAPAWHSLVGWLEAAGATPTWRWGSAKSGWELRCARAGRPFTTLLPRRTRFTAQVVVGPTIAAEVAALPLLPATRVAFDSAHPYPDGRWLFLEISDASGVADVERILEAKLPPRVRAQVTPAG
jgi:hypothetical protein